MKLRLVLPPNLAARAERDAIPTKVELDKGEGKPLPPEKLDPSVLGDLPDAQRAAAFVLAQWCGGKIASFVQLTKLQLGELVKILHGLDCFFLVGSPKAAIPWANGELTGVSEHLESAEEEKPEEAPRREHEVAMETAVEDPFEKYQGPPIVVEGSTHFLLITLPSEDHPRYLKALRLLREWNFVRDQVNQDWWWLRDRRKTLDFIALHRTELEDYYQAEFTENFLQRSQGIKEAKLKTSVSEDGESSEVTVRIEAGNLPQSEIEHALAIGQNYLESGNKVYFFPKEKLEKLHLLQRKLSGDPRAPLLHHGTFPVSRENSPEAEEMIAEFDPNFKSPQTWKERGTALRDLSQLKPAPLSPELNSILRPYQKIGVAWMLHLFKHKLGGILADEMG
ncbi:MAG: hypothetical protein VCA36_04930, partial [Opitutales bacterium]